MPDDKAGGYTVPPVFLLTDVTELARLAHITYHYPRAYPTLGKVWRITRERQHAVDGDCWCGTVHLAMAGLTLEMLREFYEHEHPEWLRPR